MIVYILYTIYILYKQYSITIYIINSKCYDTYFGGSSITEEEEERCWRNVQLPRHAIY